MTARLVLGLKKGQKIMEVETERVAGNQREKNSAIEHKVGAWRAGSAHERAGS